MMTGAVVLLLSALVVLVGIVYLRGRLANPPDKHDLQAAIGAQAEKYASKSQINQLVIGVYKEGRSVISGYRVSGEAQSSIPDDVAVFQIGSLTKLFTATLLQILCDERVVGMEQTLGDLLGDRMPLAPAVRQVTLRQLACHTSGFPRIPEPLLEQVSKAAQGGDIMLDPYSYLEPESVFAYLATAPGMKSPGRFEYSNYGMGLLGHVLEVVTGKRLEALLEEKIFAPLGMGSTAVNLSPTMLAHLMPGHAAKGAPAGFWRFASLGGAGALSANARDMLKFIQSNLTQGGLLARPFEKMRQAQFKGDSGIGWIQPTLIDKLLGNNRTVWHNGMVGGYASYLAVDADSQAGVVILANKALAHDMLGMLLMRQARTQSWS